MICIGYCINTLGLLKCMQNHVTKHSKNIGQYFHSYIEKSRFISTSPVFFSYTKTVISVLWTYSKNYSRHSSTQCKLCKNIQIKKSYSNVVFIAKLIKHVLFFDSKQAMNFQIQITTNLIFGFVVMFPNNISKLHISAYCGDSILHLNNFTINAKKKTKHLFYNWKFE